MIMKLTSEDKFLNWHLHYLKKKLKSMQKNVKERYCSPSDDFKCGYHEGIQDAIIHISEMIVGNEIENADWYFSEEDLKSIMGKE